MAENKTTTWKPLRLTMISIESGGKKGFKKFRASSSGYIAKSSVRAYIFKRDNYECVLCKSLKLLEIDHIKSVHKCYKEKEFKYCNSLDNLQTLCKKCNTAKLP